MEDFVRIDGIQCGQLTMPIKSAQLTVKIGENGTLRLGDTPNESGYGVLLITLKTKDLQGEMDIHDSSGRLVLSWRSSKEHSTQPTSTLRGNDSVLPPSPAQKSVLPNTEDSAATFSTTLPTTSSHSEPKAPKSKPTQPQSIPQNQRTWILQQLVALMNRKGSQDFNDPVDTQEYPQYLEIIERPMDFRTIHRNFKSSRTHYPTVRAIMEDFHLVIDNAVKFNGKGHDISRKALYSKNWFQRRMKNLPAPQNDKEPKTSKRKGGDIIAERRSMHPRVELEDLEPNPPTKPSRPRRRIVEAETPWKQLKQRYVNWEDIDSNFTTSAS